MEMKDLTFSAKGTGFVRLNGMDRMLVAILVAFDRDQREFGDRQSKQSINPPGGGGVYTSHRSIGHMQT